MRKITKSVIIESAFMPIVVAGIVTCLVFFYSIGGLFQTILFSTLFAFGIGVYIYATVKKYYRLTNFSFIILVLCLLLIAGHVTMEKLTCLKEFLEPENLRQMIENASPWGELIFIAITFAQVTLVPIPSTITVVLGVAVFGLGPSILYSTVGLLIGSMFAFFLGRVFGMKIVRVTIGEGMYNKYQSIMKGKDVTMLFLMFLLPLFPDDLLCIVAGLTSMSYLQFFIMMLVCRPIGVAATSLSAKMLEMIPLNTTWGIITWIIIIAVILVAAFLLMKYSNIIQDRMFDFFDKHLNKARRVKGANLNRVDLHQYYFVKDAIVTSNISYYSLYGGGDRKLVKKKKKRTPRAK